MNIPLALAKAADASLPTLVDEGRLVLRIRLTHASGGSNSTAEAGSLGATLFVAVLSSTLAFSLLASSSVVGRGAGVDAIGCVCVVRSIIRGVSFGWSQFSNFRNHTPKIAELPPIV